MDNPSRSSTALSSSFSSPRPKPLPSGQWLRLALWIDCIVGVAYLLVNAVFGFGIALLQDQGLQQRGRRAA